MRMRRYQEPHLLTIARRNRLEIIQAKLSRREMIRYGLIGASGYLAFKNGLSHWASGGAAWAASGPGGGGGGTVSPPTRAFIEPLPLMPIRRPVTTLTGPAPSILPNWAA